ncbi:PREDICTED: small EDRK-rich factor 1-like [Lipotes vexillifer]|uniref:Small EDRK-rich factor 1-like n=1 Tax=Lipotes vexillifer TaxID=118797 RepID=A0A340X7Y0_LIPVE|nr:PREDICTED: small EDRK-rich factor 1-like [Lipotes vexillifer]
MADRIGWKSEIKMLAGPHSLKALEENTSLPPPTSGNLWHPLACNFVTPISIGHLTIFPLRFSVSVSLLLL